LSTAVKLPPGEDPNDWLAVHGKNPHHLFVSSFTDEYSVPVVDFFNRINLIYGTICESCTEQSCPTMSGGPKFEYLWCDGQKYKKPTPLPAPQYIAQLMDWVEAQINDESLFPVKVGEY
jgi:hypothetical protein